MSTKIAWTDESWNVVVGCTKVSAGCLNCYAERMAHRVRGMMYIQSSDKSMETWAKYDEVLTMSGKWNGHAYCDESALEKPLHWKKPRMIFVCSMGDLFHPSVPFEFIDKVMAVIALCPQHTFQVLTKRPERMLEYFSHWNFIDNVATKACQMVEDGDYAYDKITDDFIRSDYKLPNLIGMVTAENQKQADIRIPLLLQCGFLTTGVSVEPMLSPVDMQMIMMPTSKPKGSAPYDCLRGTAACENGWIKDPVCGKLDWVIIGCESGPGRRYCSSDWAMSLIKQCRASGVAVFVKQLSDQRTGRVIKNPAGWPQEFPKQLPEGK